MITTLLKERTYQSISDAIDVTALNAIQLVDTGATNLTDIACNAGQIFVFRCTNANTTLVHNTAKIICNGGASLVSSVNSIFICYGYSANKAIVFKVGV